MNIKIIFSFHEYGITELQANCVEEGEENELGVGVARLSSMLSSRRLRTYFTFFPFIQDTLGLSSARARTLSSMKHMQGRTPLTLTF